MNQYSGNSRQRQNSSQRRAGGRYGYDSGRSEFATIMLFYVLPFVVVNLIIFILVTATPKGTVTIGESSDYISTSLELKVKSLLPVKAPVVTLDGNPIEMQKTASNTYTATLTSNGVLQVDLNCVNTMKTVIYEQVNVLDDAPPSIDDAIVEDGVLSFYLEDTQSGVEYSSVYGFNDTQTDIPPLSIDRSTGLVSFDMTTETLTVCAKDLIGNELRMVFGPEGEVNSNVTGTGEQGGQAAETDAGTGEAASEGGESTAAQ